MLKHVLPLHPSVETENAAEHNRLGGSLHPSAGATITSGSSAYAQQPDPIEERIKKLEDQLQAVTQELTRLKEEAAAQKQKSEAAAQKQKEEAAAQRQDAKQEAAPQPSAETQVLKKEVEQLKSQVADVQEQATTTETKLEESGVRAYLGPGLIFEDPRGRWRMQISARAQVDYRAYQPSFTNADTFSIRRARIGVGATILDDYYVYVEEEFANQATSPAPSTGPQLTFAYAEFNWFRPGVRFRIGQFKPSIGLDNTMLDLQTDFLERALTQNLLGSVYDTGIQVFGEPTPGLFYSGSITNGSGQGNSEPQGNISQAQNDGKMGTLRLVNDFAQTFRIPDTVIHLGGTYQHGGLPNSGVNNQAVVSATSEQTEARGLTFFIPQPFNPANSQPLISTIDRTTVDLEAAFARGPFKIQGDYVEAQYAGSVSATGADFNRSLKAYYVTLGWVISGENYSDWYRGGTFVRPAPENNFGWKRRRLVSLGGESSIEQFRRQRLQQRQSEFHGPAGPSAGRAEQQLSQHHLGHQQGQCLFVRPEVVAQSLHATDAESDPHGIRHAGRGQRQEHGLRERVYVPDPSRFLTGLRDRWNNQHERHCIYRGMAA